MSDKRNYMGEIFGMLGRLDETDERFIRLVHAILLRHEERKKSEKPDNGHVGK